MRPPLSVPEMLVNGQGAVYGALFEPAGCGEPTSVGKAVQSNVSCTQRTRRNARFEVNCFITPGFVSTPAVIGGLFVQFALVIVPLAATVGHVPVVAVNS